MYRQRIADRTVEVVRCQRQHLLLGYARLALVLLGIAVVWFAFYRDSISRWWLLLVCVIFVVVARRHSAVLERKTGALRAIAFFERGVARIEDRWSELPAPPFDVDASGSLFADDLDLFRGGGLFELLDTARTSAGRNTLAAWLLTPATRDEIHSRQDAVCELAALAGLREDLASRGHADFETLDIESLTQWASATPPQVPAWLRWIAPLLALLTIAAAVLYLVADRGWPLLAVVLVDATITFALLKRTQAIFRGTEEASEGLRLASALIARCEQETFASPHLDRLHSGMKAQHQSAARALAHLARLASMMEQRSNFIMRVLDAPLMYSVQVALAAQRWRRRYGDSLPLWLEALGEVEALQSLATYRFEHPLDPFPELLDGEPCFESTALGHPLIAAATCVRNDVALCGETKLLLVSGSNMSGKSTLLRSVGVNAVLAMAGAPVRAQSLRMTPMRIGASIRLNDSLQEGRSRFYSEILRLRAVCELAEQQPPVLFLLDELLDGTNSSDRLIGASGIARALLDSGAIGLISTHDLALTEMGAAEGARRNMHFEERIENDEMHFDFKLREGVVTTSNGIALMRMVGLKI